MRLLYILRGDGREAARERGVGGRHRPGQRRVRDGSERSLLVRPLCQAIVLYTCGNESQFRTTITTLLPWLLIPWRRREKSRVCSTDDG